MQLSESNFSGGRHTEYGNKGQVIRTYQPYYLDDWRYVADDSTRNHVVCRYSLLRSDWSGNRSDDTKLTSTFPAPFDGQGINITDNNRY